MAAWTVERVAERFREAAITAHRLPPVRVQGYFNTWPAIRRMPWETLGAEPSIRLFPPAPETVERMLGVAGLPTSLAALGVREDDLPALADMAGQQWTATFNPRPVTAEDLLGIYRSAYD